MFGNSFEQRSITYFDIYFLLWTTIIVVSTCVSSTRIYYRDDDRIQNFRRLRIDEDSYVDKSLLIDEYLTAEQRIILITRPRNWGKTVNSEMLYAFLQIETNEHGQHNRTAITNSDRRKLFAGGELDDKNYNDNNNNNNSILLSPLRIAEYSRSMRYLGNVPTVRIDFGIGLKGDTYEEIEAALKTKIAQLYRRYRYLEKTVCHANPYDLRDFRMYCRGEFDTNALKNSLQFLSRLLYRHFDRPIHAIIDNYDAPISDFFRLLIIYETNRTTNALKETYVTVTDFRKTLRLFRYLLSRTFDRNPFIEKALINGVIKLAGLNFLDEDDDGYRMSANNFLECDVTRSCFSEYYGFTQSELDRLLIRKTNNHNNNNNKRNINFNHINENDNNIIKNNINYNDDNDINNNNTNNNNNNINRNKIKKIIYSRSGGYRIGDRKMYNPFSVRKFLLKKDKKSNDLRMISGDIRLIKNVLSERGVESGEGRDTLTDLIKLSVGKSIIINRPLKSTTEISFMDVGFSELYPLLLHYGYLTIDAGSVPDDEPRKRRNSYSLKVPNSEANRLFEKSIAEWTESNLPSTAFFDDDDLINAMYRDLSTLNVNRFENRLRTYVNAIRRVTFERNAVKNVYTAGVYRISRRFIDDDDDGYYLIYQEINDRNGTIALVSKPNRANNAIIIAYEIVTIKTTVKPASLSLSLSLSLPMFSFIRRETLTITAKNLLNRTRRKRYERSVKERYRYVNETVTLAVSFDDRLPAEFALEWSNNDYYCVKFFGNLKIPRII